MKRLILAVVWLFCGLPNLVYAETIAAIPATQWKSLSFPASPWQTTQTAACVFHCANYTSYTACSAGTTLTSCAGVTWNGTPFSSVEVLTYDTAGLGCPPGQNWTLSGSSCTRPDCVAPQTRGADGVCIVTCPPAGSNAMIGGASAYGISGTSAACVSGIVFSSCAITCASGVSAGGKASCTGCTFTGANNLSGDTASPIGSVELKDATVTPTECLAQGKGYITTSSGTTCVASADSPNPVKSTEVAKTTTTGAGAGTSETTTECEGGNCTSTTTNKDGAGTVTGTTTATGTDPAAKEKDPETDCDKFPNSAGCLELGSPPTGDEVGTKPIESAITPVSMGSAVCPSDVNLPKGAKFSWGPVCDFATDLRPVIIALAWLAAAFIVLGFSRGN